MHKYVKQNIIVHFIIQKLKNFDQLARTAKFKVEPKCIVAKVTPLTEVFLQCKRFDSSIFMKLKKQTHWISLIA